MSISHPVKDGVVSDWDLYSSLWHHAFDSYSLGESSASPVILTEKSHNPASNRMKMGEVLFETMKVPSLFIAKDAALACYACGRTTGMVIDCGASGTSISPVVDGWVESRGLNRTNIGGRYMDAYAMHLIREKHRPVANGTPAHSLHLLRMTGANAFAAAKSKQLQHPTYDAFMSLEMARLMKESISRVAMSSLRKEQPESLSTSPFELPDGSILNLGIEKYHCPEMFFDPASFGFDEGKDLEPLNLKSSNISNLTQSVPKLVSDSIFKCDTDLQANLHGNMIVVGGAASYGGLPQRLRKEVEMIVRESVPHAVGGVLSPLNNERSVAAWLGGSILGSMGSMNDIFVTKKEYDEVGTSIIEKKCP
jgi:actin-related protein